MQTTRDQMATTGGCRDNTWGLLDQKQASDANFLEETTSHAGQEHGDQSSSTSSPSRQSNAGFDQTDDLLQIKIKFTAQAELESKLSGFRPPL